MSPWLYLLHEFCIKYAYRSSRKTLKKSGAIPDRQETLVLLESAACSPKSSFWKTILSPGLVYCEVGKSYAGLIFLKIAMGTSRILHANWYNHPKYYDIAFQACTSREADFIEAVCRKYCLFKVSRFLEPACGSGRLITEFAARGYQVTGFDLSRPALSYLRRRLAKRRLYAEIFAAEMSEFCLGRSADSAYCLINTFSHLLTEQAARSHLECIASSVRPGGIYVLAMR